MKTFNENLKCPGKYWPRECSEDSNGLCIVHQNENIIVNYSPLTKSCTLHDVAELIAKEIDDPNTFSNFAKVCLSTAKACHKLQNVKKMEFSTIYMDERTKIGWNIVRVLPNGKYWYPALIKGVNWYPTIKGDKFYYL